MHPVFLYPGLTPIFNFERGHFFMKSEDKKITEEGFPDVGTEQATEPVAQEGVSGAESTFAAAESTDEPDTSGTPAEDTEHGTADKKGKGRKKSSNPSKNKEMTQENGDTDDAENVVSNGADNEPEKVDGIDNVTVSDPQGDDKPSKALKKQVKADAKKHKEYLDVIRNIEKAVDNVYASDDNGRIVSVNGTLEAESADQKIKDLKATLVDSFRNRHSLTGTISGVITSPESSLIYAELYYEGVKVIFPMSELVDAAEFADANNPKAFAMSLMQNRQGSEIDFIVAGGDGESLAGTRREAMKQQRYRYYLRSDRNNDKESYRIEIGKNVECRVVSVMMQNIILEVHGVETWEPISELSWSYIFDARENYYPGMMLNAKVIFLDTADKDDIKINVSVKQLLPNMQLKVSKSMNEGSSYCGKATYFDDSGHVYIKLNNGADCRCNCLAGMPRPQRDTRVIVLLKHIVIREKRAFLFGLVTRAYSARR